MDGGQYQLATGTPGYDQGVRIANFNDGFLGTAPDVGAHEGGSAAMKFGLAASSGPAIAAGGTLPSTGTTTTTGTTGTTGSTSTGSTNTSSGVKVSNTALDFSKARTQTVTFTNHSGAKVTFIRASMSSARYMQTNTCGDVPAGGSCSATITYYPAYTGSSSGTFTVTSTAPNSPHRISLTANGNKRVVLGN